MTARADIRLLLADVDGTLVTNRKTLTEATISAARDLSRSGIALAIVSGRPPRGMRMLVEPLALGSVIAGFNGAVLARRDMSVIESRLLDMRVAKAAGAFLMEHRLDVWIYTEEAWLVRDANAPHVARETQTVQFSPQPVPEFTDEHFESVAKIVGVSDDLECIAKCEIAMQTLLGSQVSALRSQPYYLDVTHPLANKGAVVKALSRLLKMPADHIATIGDMPNDVPMFKESGFSIAMGNADDAVKAHADAVTSGNEDEGFAKAVKALVLRDSAS